MVKKVSIHPCQPVSGSIRPPGSKSITNRALICAALAQGSSQLDGVLDSEDTQVMIEAWRHLGLRVDHDPDAQTVLIEGCGGLPPIRQANLYVANSGTTIRFLSAALCACGGKYELDGVERMRQRPIADLLNALRELGGHAESLNQADSRCPPIKIDSKGLSGGKARVAGNISSQFLSGLMMAAPLAQAPVTLEVTGELVSLPYVRMTASVMRCFGADVSGDNCGPFLIDTRRRYQATHFVIEPDASAASYFWAAAAITGGSATVLGLNQSSLQGDVRFCEVLRQMGCQVHYSADGTTVRHHHDGSAHSPLVGVDVNMADISDTVQTLAAVALFAKGPTTVRGVAHNRVKETDRIGDLAVELRKLGARVDEFFDGMTIHPPQQIQPCHIETYHDHRMAMSLALVGLRAPGVVICDPDCTGKTYPKFWQDLARFANTTLPTSH